MANNWLLRVATFLFVIFLIALLAWLTMAPAVDPCDETEVDVGAAVLGDGSGDQEGLINRAIIKRGACKKEPQKREDAEPQDQ